MKIIVDQTAPGESELQERIRELQRELERVVFASEFDRKALDRAMAAVAAGATLIEEQRRELARLRERVAELEGRFQ